MTTAIFITTSNNKTPQSLNRRHLVFSCTGVDTMADRWQVRRSCQSTIVGAACAELRHSDWNLRTAWFEKGDFKTGIFLKKNTGWIFIIIGWMYTHFQHTFMCKQLVKWILYPMTPLTQRNKRKLLWKKCYAWFNLKCPCNHSQKNYSEPKRGTSGH